MITRGLCGLQAMDYKGECGLQEMDYKGGCVEGKGVRTGWVAKMGTPWYERVRSKTPAPRVISYAQFGGKLRRTGRRGIEGQGERRPFSPLSVGAVSPLAQISPRAPLLTPGGRGYKGRVTSEGVRLKVRGDRAGRAATREGRAHVAQSARLSWLRPKRVTGTHCWREPGASQRGALTRCRRLHDGQQVGCAKVVLRGESVGFLRG